MDDSLKKNPEKPVVPQEQAGVSSETSISKPAHEQQEFIEQSETIPSGSSVSVDGDIPSHPIAQPDHHAPQVPVHTLGKSEQLKKIESVLEEGLEEAFASMDAQHQHMFKEAGENTAREIEGVINAVKVQTQRVFELIKSWLRIIPGVSKWFVVQEAKIKTDKILHMKD